MRAKLQLPAVRAKNLQWGRLQTPMVRHRVNLNGGGAQLDIHNLSIGYSQPQPTGKPKSTDLPDRRATSTLMTACTGAR